MSIITDNFDTIYGVKGNIQALRDKVLELAIQGKLVEQDENDEPASELLIKVIESQHHISGKIKEKQHNIIEIDESDIPFEIPFNWEWAKLGDVLLTRRGASPRPIKSFQTNNEDGVNWIKIGDATRGGKYIMDTIEKITPEGAKKSVFLKKGALIMSNSMSFGKAYILGIDGCIHDGWLSFEFDNSQLNPELLQMFLSASYRRFAEKAAGGSVLNLNIDRVKSTLFPIPPLKEQHRIVDKVEKLMAEIDKLEQAIDRKKKLIDLLPKTAVETISSCETAEELQERMNILLNNFPTIFQSTASMQELRSVILQLAIEGKLVKQDPEDEPAIELLKCIKEEKDMLLKDGKIKKQIRSHILNEGDIQFEIPDSWKWVRLSELTSKIGSGSTPTGGKKVYKSKGVVFIRSQNVYNDGLRLENVAFIDEKTHQRKLFSEVNKNDVLLNITGASIGRCAIVPNDFERANVNQHVSIIRLVNIEINKFLHLVLTSIYGRKLIMSEQVGSSREGLSGEKLANFPIPIPPLKEQYRIVEKVEALMNIIDNMEKELSRKDKLQELMPKAAVENLE